MVGCAEGAVADLALDEVAAGSPNKPSQAEGVDPSATRDDASAADGRGAGGSAVDGGSTTATDPSCSGGGTDSDGDGAPDCSDACPDDPNKTKLGVCGCGERDTDADFDGVLDCDDACDDDSEKSEAGVCGCGVAETDSDKDGTPDCDDGCPGDPLSTKAGACAYAITPSNVAATQLVFTDSPTWNCNAAGTTTIDSTAASVVSTSCALGSLDVLADVEQLDAGGPNVMVVRLNGLTVSNAHVLKLVGDKPIVVLVDGDVLVDLGGRIDAGAIGPAPGPGGNLAAQCAGQTGGDGSVTNDGGGGGGGGFGTPGGKGGVGSNDSGTEGAAGAASAVTDLVPLRGGCAGGKGGGSNNAAAGAGGGAFQITASGTITVGTATNAATLSAGGGAGAGQPNNSGCNGDGGDGGGSGGGILLEAGSGVVFGSGGAVRAHGGAGGGGTECGNSDAGQDGHVADDINAVGGAGNNGNNDGAVGGLCSGAGCMKAGAPGAAPTSSGFGAGAGGGGGGRIVVHQ